MMALGGKPSHARESGEVAPPTSDASMMPSSPTVHDVPQPHHPNEANDQDRAWWKRKKEKQPSGSRTHAQARLVEKGPPQVLHGREDVEGQARLQRASKLLRAKNLLIATLSEFIGTYLFLFLAFGIANAAPVEGLIASTEPGTSATGGLNAAALLVSASGFGFALAVNAWLWFRVSGGLFNPAITLALFLTGSLSIARAILFMIVQFAGGIAAAGMAQVLIPGGINVRTRVLEPSVTQGFFIEFFMTSQLILAVFMLAGEKHKGTFLAPVGIGLALFIGELFSTPITGGSLNPARTLGPDVIASSFDGSTWIYYAAPFSAAIVCSALYLFLRWSNYSTAAPDQDDDGENYLLRDTQGHSMGYLDRVEDDASELGHMRANTAQRRISREHASKTAEATDAPAQAQSSRTSAPA